MASYASNEVSINWNAPLVFALAGALGQVELFRREVSGLKPRSSQMPKDVSAGQIQAPMPFIERRIYVIRSQKVMLASDLAEIYQVPAKAPNQAVRRNPGRFPEDFMFRLSSQEFDNWRSQIVTSNPSPNTAWPCCPLFSTACVPYT